jgi:hypothetical protein
MRSLSQLIRGQLCVNEDESESQHWIFFSLFSSSGLECASINCNFLYMSDLSDSSKIETNAAMIEESRIWCSGKLDRWTRHAEKGQRRERRTLVAHEMTPFNWSEVKCESDAAETTYMAWIWEPAYCIVLLCESMHSFAHSGMDAPHLGRGNTKIPKQSSHAFW